MPNLSRDGDAAAWDENANAGLETVPLDDGEHELPYVIKFPWLYQCIDHVLANGRSRIDAVIVPVRDLVDAAASRTIVDSNERTANADELRVNANEQAASARQEADALRPLDAQ